VFGFVLVNFLRLADGDLLVSLQILQNRKSYRRLPVIICKIFYKKSCWLRMQTQEAIGIPGKFTKKDIDENDLQQYEKSEVPFGPAIKALTEARVFVPSDILHSILQSIRHINSCAIKNSGLPGNEAVVGADDLFPMVVYVVVQSQLKDINARLGFLERYVKYEVKYFGEAAICLSLIQAAVAFISIQKPSEFGLPDEIEDEIQANLTKEAQQIKTSRRLKSTIIKEKQRQKQYRHPEEARKSKHN